GKSPSPRTEFLYYRSKVECIRQGDWKLHATGKQPRLYNLAEDIGESKNVAKANPEVVTRLQARMQELDGEITRGMRPDGKLTE
ncbi:MAG: arylsulfatase, partial [Akkermansiaceae bacterium]